MTSHQRETRNSVFSALSAPVTDPTPLFEVFRGNYATELLAAAATHFHLFDRLASRPMSFEELRRELRLATRPANVLCTALRGLGLMAQDAEGRLELTAMSREHLVSGSSFNVSDYIGLAATSPGVKAMIERLESNHPAGAKAGEGGPAYIFREGMESAMEKEKSARSLTLALAGRSKNVAPVLARQWDLRGAKRLLDVGGGTGIYSVACLQQHPDLRAVVWDRPEVLKVAREMALAYGVAERMECVAGDMFRDPVPRDADVMLLSNVLHDWDTPECAVLVQRCAEALGSGGRLVIHDVFLDDDLGGPLPVALYSAALFTLTEGRAYSAAEYRAWLRAAGLQTEEGIIPTLIHCGMLTGTKP